MVASVETQIAPGVAFSKRVAEPVLFSKSLDTVVKREPGSFGVAPVEDIAPPL